MKAARTRYFLGVRSKCLRSRMRLTMAIMVKAMKKLDRLATPNRSWVKLGMKELKTPKTLPKRMVANIRGLTSLFVRTCQKLRLPLRVAGWVRSSTKKMSRIMAIVMNPAESRKRLAGLLYFTMVSPRREPTGFVIMPERPKMATSEVRRSSGRMA